MAKQADARDLKSRIPHGVCGFDPRSGHLFFRTIPTSYSLAHSQCDRFCYLFGSVGDRRNGLQKTSPGREWFPASPQGAASEQADYSTAFPGPAGPAVAGWDCWYSGR